ncbi:MAG TPA: urea ABC transporter permease subunit UrtB [bacterium]|nr:urea ABC transporter permease subunit UrtB [bacterium]
MLIRTARRVARWLPLALLLILPALVSAASPAVPPEVAQAVRKLGSDDRDTILVGVDKLGELSDAAALPALEALMNGNLRTLPDGRVVIADDDKGIVTDALTGAQQSAKGLQLNEPIINNRVRRELEPVMAQLRLGAANPEVRLAAARNLAAQPDPDQAPRIRAALAKETVPEIRSLLTVALARLDLQSSDARTRLTAVQELRDSGRVDVKADLENLIATLPNGAPGEPDPEVRAAAVAGIKSIDHRQAWISAAGNFIYGLSLGSVLLLAALGLAITFGLMGVINMAHGEMLMLGAYATYVVQGLFQTYLPGAFDWYLLASLPAAFIVCAVAGIVLERGVIRFLYGRPLETLLATWGISLILIQSVRMVFGAQNVSVANPSWLSGGYRLLPGLVLPYNRMGIVVLMIVTVTGVWLLLQHTRLGLHVRAVTQNRPIAAGMGIRTNLVDMWTFALGSGVAGLGGVALSQIGNVGPELGQSYIVDSFMVVVLGGVGKVVGAVIGAIGLGVVSKFIEPFSDAVIAKIVVLTFIILFIQKRPQGLFALKGRTAET